MGRGRAEARKGWLIHAAAFAVVNPLIFVIQQRRGQLAARGVLIQLVSWGAGLGLHYHRALRRERA